MTTTITFNELRKIKDNLPQGSMHKIAQRLNISEDAVRNYFGATKYKQEAVVGVHYEQGPDGGIVCMDDTSILEAAKQLLAETHQ
jgi:hypothetical protein